MLEDARERHGGRRSGGLRGDRSGQRHTHSGLDDVHRQQSDEQRERRDNFEVDQRLQGQPTDAFHVVAMSGDADNQRPEDERRDDRFDHAQEHRRDRAQRHRKGWKQGAQRDAEHHGDEDPLRQGTAAKESPHRAA